MGCFPACFISSTSKRRKGHNSDQGQKTTEALQLTEPAKRENDGDLIKLIRESREEVEEQVSCIAKKRVTFDLNVKSYEESSAREVACDLVEGEEEKWSGNDKEVLKETKPLLDAIALSKVASFTQNNRYQNCRKSTDGWEDIGLEDNYLEDKDEDDDHGADDKWAVVQEESSESLFSLSIDSRKQVCDADKGEKEVNSPMPIGSFSEKEVKLEPTGSCRNAGKWCHFGHSLLSPIENFAQWKEVKERPPLVKHQEKENISFEQEISVLISPEPTLKRENHSLKPNSSKMKPTAEQEIGVDISLSSWLVVSEMTVKSRAGENHSMGNSDCDKKRELKQASASLSSWLVVSEMTDKSRAGENHSMGNSDCDKKRKLKQASASLSQTSSRGQSPHATPLMGTVGSYWVHTGQNMDSDSGFSGERSSITERENRKDQTVTCNPTPFEVRLSRALDAGVC